LYRLQAPVVSRPQVANFDHGSPCRSLAWTALKADGAPDHHLNELPSRQVCGWLGPHFLAVPQDGHDIRHLLHLFKVMRDEENRQPFRYESSERLEQLATFLWSENRGWFIENDRSRPARENLQDLDALLNSDREQPHFFVWIDLEPELFGKRPGLLGFSPTID